jgi:TM2 domain-containing membrane protein YozV
MTSKIKFCGKCGQELPTNFDVTYCPKCGEKIDGVDTNISHNESNDAITGERKEPTYQPSVVAQLPYKSPGTAALIAFIGGLFGLPGIGHIYVGKLGNGIGILILGLVIFAFMIIFAFALPPLALFFSIGYLALFIWQIFNARTKAREFNESVQRTGKEPW